MSLKLAHKWAIASHLGPGGSGGTVDFSVVIVELFDERTGIRAWGEASPSTRYNEDVQFIEQPMPATTPRSDWVWLKERSPIPLIADESYVTAADASFCGECFHGVNVKLVKAGGITPAFEALQAARKHGLKTLLGCMIETSILLSAAAHLAELTDFLDLDGNLLITNDPFMGVACDNGLLAFSENLPTSGLRVMPRRPA